MSYETLVDKAFENLHKKQDLFELTYDVNSYSHWFYNQSTGLLRFYNDDTDEIYFEYIPIGSYSIQSNTWMWTWNNKFSAEQRKYDAIPIRDFGFKHDYEKLHSGQFDADEYTGWELTAIALHQLGGIGGYRVESEHLQIYFLLTDVVSSAEARKRVESLIDCPRHGKIRKAFVCQHLNQTQKTGFEEAFPTHIGMQLGDDDDFQAWCDACEKVRLAHDGWNEESMKFANIKLVCERCYFEFKDFNLGK